MYKLMIYNPLKCYLDSFNLLNKCNPFLAVALADDMFPTTLLKMIGGLEQKLKEIAWQVATDDLEFRRDLLYNTGGIHTFKYKDSFNYKDIKSLYDYINLKTDKNSRATDNINNQIEFYEEAYKILSSQFGQLNFIHTAFISHWELFESNELIKSIKNNNKKNILKAANKFNLKELLNSAIDSRHKFAHNTYSFQARFSSLSRVGSSSHPENYFMYFFILIYIDHCFMDIIKNLRNL